MIAQRYRMPSIPKRCRWIALEIRSRVRKPKPSDFDFLMGVYRTKKGTCCPMGMHPEVIGKAPTLDRRFPGGKDHDMGSVNKFGSWWDSLPESKIRSAIRAVWGRE